MRYGLPQPVLPLHDAVRQSLQRFTKPYMDTMTPLDTPVRSYEPDSILASDGLTYKFKSGGSPFKDSANMSTMSCYRCGLHRPRSMGSFTRLLNQRMFLCQNCSPKALPPRP